MMIFKKKYIFSSFLVGGCHEGSAPLFSDLLVAYEVHQGWSLYTETDEPVKMLTLIS